jgi:orotate phosphoribosyltransferase
VLVRLKNWGAGVTIMNIVSLGRGNQDLKKRADEGRDKLFQIIKAKSYDYSPKPIYKLASGEMSNYYFDMKMTMLDPDGISLIGDVLKERLSRHNAGYVAGLELGAVPLIIAACMHGYRGLIVRKDKKEHGTKKLVEGPLPPGNTEVILLDDVTTKGGSVLTAVMEVRKAKCVVNTVITLVDREDEARQTLVAKGVTLEPIFTLTDFRTA